MVSRCRRGRAISSRDFALPPPVGVGLPVDRQIVISVGNVDRHHKRMDYLINEVASMPPPRPFVLILGAMDEGSPAIIAEGRQKLGDGGFAARSVPYEKVFRHYQAADCFALSSLREGFGRVYVEASMHGLPCARTIRR